MKWLPYKDCYKFREESKWDDIAPKNWCFLRIQGFGESDSYPYWNPSHQPILGKWSRSAYCWIGIELTGIFNSYFARNPDLEYRETDFRTLEGLVYKGFSKGRTP
jgi:hypothetical protein